MVSLSLVLALGYKRSRLVSSPCARALLLLDQLTGLRMRKRSGAQLPVTRSPTGLLSFRGKLSDWFHCRTLSFLVSLFFSPFFPTRPAARRHFPPTRQFSKEKRRVCALLSPRCVRCTICTAVGDSPRVLSISLEMNNFRISQDGPREIRVGDEPVENRTRRANSLGPSCISCLFFSLHSLSLSLSVVPLPKRYID